MTWLLKSVIALVLSTLGASLVAMQFLPKKNKFIVKGRTVVITGGSQGLGRGIAKLLSSKGANIAIVARDQLKLDAAEKYIASFASEPSSQKFLTISADVTRAEENLRIIKEVTAWNDGQPPDIVWANAGGCLPKFFMDCSVEELRSQMELNYWAAAYLAQATLKEWMGPVRPSAAGDKHHDGGNRHFIMTSSTVAFVGVAGYTPYAVAKTALRSLADSLRSELNYYNGARRRNPALGPASDMKAHIVFSGTISSPGLEAENAIKHPITKMLEADDPIQTEDEVATAAVRGLERGHHLITTQLLGRAMQASAWGGSPRNSRVFDTILSWITSLAWLFIQPDMDRKVFRYGAEHGMAWSK